MFLAGVRYKTQNHKNLSQHSLSFAIEQQKLNGTKLTLKFITTSNLPIESVTLSYLIYSPSDITFGSYGGIISELNIKGIYNINLNYLFPSHHFHPIFGISAIDASRDK